MYSNPPINRAMVSVTIKGTEELTRRLQMLSDAVAADALKEAALAGAEVVLADAKVRVPVRTGNLRDSLEANVSLVQRDRAEVEVGPNDDGFYGYWIERGKKGYAAHPFLRPALDENCDKAIAHARKVLAEKIKGVVP